MSAHLSHSQRPARHARVESFALPDWPTYGDPARDVVIAAGNTPENPDLFCFAVRGADDEHQRLRQFLSPDELARADRYTFPHLQRHFALCRGRVRELLAIKENCRPQELQFQYGHNGKPRVVGSNWHFSLSHSGGLALLAVAFNQEIGVDIETIRPEIRCLELADRFFHTDEAQYLRQLPEADQRPQFFQLWTFKEALIKALGDGLACPLDSFCVIPHPSAPQLIWSNSSRPSLALRSLPLTPLFCAALAVTTQSEITPQANGVRCR